jgi:hypothetical protein
MTNARPRGLRIWYKIKPHHYIVLLLVGRPRQYNNSQRTFKTFNKVLDLGQKSHVPVLLIPFSTNKYRINVRALSGTLFIDVRIYKFTIYNYKLSLLSPLCRQIYGRT